MIPFRVYRFRRFKGVKIYKKQDGLIIIIISISNVDDDDGIKFFNQNENFLHFVF